MGIKRLCSFFEENPQLTETYFLHSTPVIIDGNSLIFKLYFTKNLDCAFGGDYRKFAEVIKKYFALLLECNIQPIVIFDGGLDKSMAKFDTTFIRFKKTISASRNIARNKFNEKLLPINAFQVYKDVLSELGIACAQSDFEADDQLPDLANHFKCPIISDDSDFFIFNIRNGFIPLSSLKPYKIKGQFNGKHGQNVLKCKIYHLKNLLSYFPGMRENVLALFGILVGNDYVHEKVFEAFSMNMKLIQFNSCKKLKVGHKHERIIKLLNWLRNHTLDKAKKLILSFLKGDQEKDMKKTIDRAIKSYTNKNSNLIPIIEKSDSLEAPIQSNSQMTTSCGKNLPLWFTRNFNSCTFPGYFLNAIGLHKVFLHCQVEDDSFSSSYKCSRYIRQVIYGILLHHNDKNSVECKKKSCISFVEEYYQCEGKIQTDQVTPVFTYKAQNALPMIDNLNNLSKKSSKKILLAVLNEKKRCLLQMPPQWKLLVLVVRYWLINCEPKPSEEFICAFLINLVYCSLLTECNSEPKCEDENVPSSESDFTPKQLSKSIPPSEVNKTNCNLKKYLNKQYGNLALHIIHSFSQLKTCINYVIDLNKLLGSPFVGTKLHKSVDGILIYNLTQAMSSYPHSIDDFVINLVGLNSTIYHLFQKVKNIILEGNCSTCFKHHTFTSPQKRKLSESEDSVEEERNPKKTKKSEVLYSFGDYSFNLQGM